MRLPAVGDLVALESLPEEMGGSVVEVLVSILVRRPAGWYGNPTPVVVIHGRHEAYRCEPAEPGHTSGRMTVIRDMPGGDRQPANPPVGTWRIVASLRTVVPPCGSPDCVIPCGSPDCIPAPRCQKCGRPKNAHNVRHPFVEHK
jgi:hypothetical protein